MANTVNNHFDRASVAVTGNKTLTAADSGIVQNVTTNGVTITLPSTALGLTFTIKNGGRYDNAVGFTVAPQAADGVTGLGFTAAVNKGVNDLIATSKPGDEITLLGTGAAGVTGWVVQNATTGAFTRVP